MEKFKKVVEYGKEQETSPIALIFVLGLGYVFILGFESLWIKLVTSFMGGIFFTIGFGDLIRHYSSRKVYWVKVKGGAK